MLLKFLKNSNIRLLFSGTLFAAAFIWMAIVSYGVDQQEIKVFLVLSLIFVGLIMGGGFIAVLLFTVLRKILASLRIGKGDSGFLGELAKAEEESNQPDTQATPAAENKPAGK